MGKIDYQFTYDVHFIFNDYMITYDYLTDLHCEEYLHLTDDHASYIGFTVLDPNFEGAYYNYNFPEEHLNCITLDRGEDNPFLLTAKLYNGIFYLREKTFGYAFNNGTEQAFKYEVLFEGTDEFDEMWDKSLIQFLSRSIQAMDPARATEAHEAFDKEIEKMVELFDEEDVDADEMMKVTARAEMLNLFYHQNNEHKSLLLMYCAMNMLVNDRYKEAYELKRELQGIDDLGLLPENEQETLELMEELEANGVNIVVENIYEEFVDESDSERAQYETIVNKMIQTFKIYSEHYLINLVDALLKEQPEYIEDDDYFKSVALQAYDAYDLEALREEEENELLAAEEAKSPTVKLSAGEVLELIFEKRYSQLNRPAILKQLDELHMTPFMYLVLLKDEAVFELYSKMPKCEPNIFGQTIHDLLSWNYDYDFTERYIEVYDYDVIHNKVEEMERLRRSIESYEKSSNRASKVGSFFGNSALGLIGDALSAGAAGEQWKREEQLEAVEREYQSLIRNYGRSGKEKSAEVLKLLFTPSKDIQALKDRFVNEQQKWDELAAKAEQAQSADQVDFNDPKVQKILLDVVKAEEEPKDEFETTKEYEARIQAAYAKLVEKANADASSVPQLAAVANQHSGALKEEIATMQSKFGAELKKLAFFDMLAENNHENEALICRAYFGDVYVYMENYDADHGRFNVKIEGDTYHLPVPRAIAREFKEQFGRLTKHISYRMANTQPMRVVKVHFNEEAYEIAYH